MKLTVLGVLTWSLAIVPGSVYGGDCTETSAELRGIREALVKLVQLEETARRDSQATILLRRIELRERRLAPLADRLRAEEAQVRELQDNQQNLDVMLEQGEDRLRSEIESGADSPLSETRKFIDDIKRSQEANTERLRVAEYRVQDLELQLAEVREDIERFDEKLAELLDEG